MEEIARYLEAIKLNPSDAEAYNGLGLCYLRGNNLLEAAAAFERATYLSPNRSEFHHNVGLTHQQLGRDMDAMNALRKAIALDSIATKSYLSLGSLLMVHGNPQEAARYFRGAWESNPNSIEGLLALSRALANEGKYVEAEARAQQSVDMDPDCAEAYVSLGNIQQQLGRFAEAIFSYERALELEPDRLILYFQIVSSKKIEELDRPMIARISAYAQDESVAATTRRGLFYALGKAYDDLGEFQRAMGSYDKANHLAVQLQRNAGVRFDPNALVAECDRNIQMFSKEMLEKHAIDGSDSQRPVFVVGLIRSGSTLIEQILSSHPDIGAAGELHFWREAAARLFARRPGSATVKPSDISGSYLSLLESIAPGKARVIDKMPGNYVLLGLIHLIFPKAKIIVCLRQPVDNCLSIYMTNFWHHSPPFGHDKKNIVFNYRQFARLVAHWREVLPAENLIEVSYEDLVQDREAVTRKMVAFCGLEWDDSCFNHEKNDRAVQTPSFWQVRQPIYKTSLERWRNYEPWLGPFADLL